MLFGCKSGDSDWGAQPIGFRARDKRPHLARPGLMSGSAADIADGAELPTPEAAAPGVARRRTDGQEPFNAAVATNRTGAKR